MREVRNEGEKGRFRGRSTDNSRWSGTRLVTGSAVERQNVREQGWTEQQQEYHMRVCVCVCVCSVSE